MKLSLQPALMSFRQFYVAHGFRFVCGERRRKERPKANGIEKCPVFSRQKKMRTLCDSCESAAAQYFCAADEAALCSNCDEKVHGCNKLANRHLRLQLRESWSVPRCDICESAPAFLHCSIDGSSLCLQCDMDVHVGGKRTHQRYLLLGQRVELPNGHHLRDEKGNPNAVDTARAWQNKYCQEHLHKVTPRHKSNDESDEQKD